MLLDTQAVGALAVADSLARSKADLGAAHCRSYEQLGDLHSHRLAVFLLAVCDVVVVVQDWIPDTDLLKFLMTCEQIMPVRMHFVQSVHVYYVYYVCYIVYCVDAQHYC